MKRVIYLLLVVAIAASFSGCGDPAEWGVGLYETEVAEIPFAVGGEIEKPTVQQLQPTIEEIFPSGLTNEEEANVGKHRYRQQSTLLDGNPHSSCWEDDRRWVELEISFQANDVVIHDESVFVDDIRLRKAATNTYQKTVTDGFGNKVQGTVTFNLQGFVIVTEVSDPPDESYCKNQREYFLADSPTASSPAPIAPEGYPLIEEFDSDVGFAFTDPDLFIQGGKVHWTVYNSEGLQYVYRSIPPFSGGFRITVTGQVDWASNNCYVRAGIGSGLGSLENIAVTFGYAGGGCPVRGYRIDAKGVALVYETDGCSPTNSLWVTPGTQYTATLTVSDTVTLDVDGVGSRTGTPIYTGNYDTLLVGSPGGGDWPDCSGSIERVIIEALGE